MNTLFHYTSGNMFRQILRQGAILPDRTEPENDNEIPTITFSSDPIWEQSRYRVGKTKDGQLIMMSKKLLQKYDGGLFRIVVPASLAPLDWFAMKEHCGMSKETIQGIYDFAIEVGARTSQWFATTESVPEDLWITVQKLNEFDEWVELPDDEVPDDCPVETDQLNSKDKSGLCFC